MTILKWHRTRTQVNTCIEFKNGKEDTSCHVLQILSSLNPQPARITLDADYIRDESLICITKFGYDILLLYVINLLLANSNY